MEELDIKISELESEVGNLELVVMKPFEYQRSPSETEFDDLVEKTIELRVASAQLRILKSLKEDIESNSKHANKKPIIHSHLIRLDYSKNATKVFIMTGDGLDVVCKTEHQEKDLCFSSLLLGKAKKGKYSQYMFHSVEKAVLFAENFIKLDEHAGRERTYIITDIPF